MSNFVPNKVFLRGVLLHYFNMKKKAAKAKDDERPGQPKNFEDHELETLLDQDPVQTQEELAKSLGVAQQTISDRLKVMGMILKKTSKMADTEVKKSRGRPGKADKAEKEVKEKETPKKRGRAAAVEAPPSKEKKVEKKSEKNGDVPAKRGRGRPPKANKKAKPAKVPGRGRGRPKAAKKSETEESEEEEKDEEEEENDDGENGEDAEEEDSS